MADSNNDPSQNTQAFQAWVDQQTPTTAAPTRSNLPLIVGGVAVLLVLLALIIWLLAS